jgi:hypothetical protein
VKSRLGQQRNLVRGILGERERERDATINSDQYTQTFKKLKQRIWRLWPKRKMNQVLLLHDNNKPHTSLHTRETTTTVGRTVLSHPPYGPDLALPNFHLFWPSEGCVPWTPFCGRWTEHSMSEEFRGFSRMLYASSLWGLM